MQASICNRGFIFVEKGKADAAFIPSAFACGAACCRRSVYRIRHTCSVGASGGEAGRAGLGDAA